MRAKLIRTLGAVLAAAVLAGCSTAASHVTPSPHVSAWTYLTSYGTGFPSDLRPTTEPGCRPEAVSVGAENRRAGTSQWRSLDRSPVPSYPVYLDSASAVCGERVGVHIGAAGAALVTVRAFRIGWYHGRGARLVWSSPPVPVTTRSTASAPGRVMTSPGWAAQVTLPVGPAWVPGLYVVATEVGHRLSGAAGLVVRDPRGSPAAVVYSQLTWNAYTTFGGASLYDGPGGRVTTRAYEVSLQRPLVAGGISSLLFEDVPTAQLLDRSGIAVDPYVDTDIDTWPSLLASRVAVVLPGHSEYWTQRMYDALTAARNDGANVADLGGNEVYWHARVIYGPDGRPSSMAVAREASLDPLSGMDPAATTVQWRDPPLSRDPSAVLGQSYTAVRARGGEQVRSVPSWLGNIRGLSVGAVLPRAAWGEVDGVWPSLYDYPPNLQVIALGVVREPGSPDKPASITYYSSDAGGGIFNAGSSYWPCMTLGECPGVAASPSVQGQNWAITRRVLVDFEHASWGRGHPSVATASVPVARLRLTLPAGAVGTAGDGD